MKKFLSIFMAILIFSVCLCGCEEEGSSSRKNSNTEKAEVFNAEKVISQLEVTEYKYERDGGIYPDERDQYLIIKNNSNFDIFLHCKLTTFDENGTIVEVITEERDAFEHDTETVLAFRDCKEFKAMKYEFTAEEAEADICITNELSYEIVEGRDEYFITVTNDGEKDALNVYGYLFYYKNGEIVNCENDMFENSYELESKESVTQNFEKHECDSYKFVLFGKGVGY